MARELFVDSSGWYALLDRRDAHHARARQIIADHAGANRLLVTTDYVIDETATLTKVRAGAHACSRFLDLIEQTKTVRIEWMNPGRFAATRHYFRKHLGHAFSFTDCVSFQVMRELRIAEAVTTDAHFVEAGFIAMLKKVR